jgi:hypothetical protein
MRTSAPPPFVSVQFGSCARHGRTRATNSQFNRLGLGRLATITHRVRLVAFWFARSARCFGQTGRVMPTPDRRTFLGTTLLGATGLGVAAVVVAGGAGVAAEFIRHPGSRSARRGSSGRASATAPPPRAPLLENALAREFQLLATLAHAGRTSPSLAARIAVLRADHQAHAAALTALITAAGVTPRTAPAASPGPAGVRPTRVADLVRWEKSAAAAVVTDFRAATGTDAAVLASIYACEQTHVAWLS